MKKDKLPTVSVPIHVHSNVPFKSEVQRLEIGGDQVVCHLRRPGHDPAIQIKGTWYVFWLRDLAAALVEHLKKDSQREAIIFKENSDEGTIHTEQGMSDKEGGA